MVELLTALTVLSILLSLAIPAFQSTLQTWQRDRAVKTLTAHLSLARSEALKTGRRTTVCNSTDGKTCAPATELEWKYGWLVYVDHNSNGTLDTDETIIATAQAQTGVHSMLANGNVRRYAFNPNGLMAAGMSTMTVQPPDEKAYKITVSRIGRVRIHATP